MKRGVILLFLLLLTFSLWAQGQAENLGTFSYVGMKLAELFERFGAPETVHAARGVEIWQDDVVFKYNEGDFYIFGDRVWQVKLPSAYGITVGDPKAATLLVLGNAAEDKGDHLLIPLNNQDWPLMMRINFNNAFAVSAIFIYRPDF